MEGSATATREDVRGGTDEQIERPGIPPVVEKLAGQHPERVHLTDEEHEDALAYFLSDEEESDEAVVHTFEVNVSATRTQKWIAWSVRPINSDEFKAIQQRARGQNRRERRVGTGEIDPAEANLLMVAEATVYPDFKEIARSKGTPDIPYIIKHRFRHKPGLIDQVAAEIMLISGFDTDDVREAKEIRAAGN